MIAAVVFVGIKETRLLHVLDAGYEESTYPEVIAWTERRLPPDAIVMAGLFSGAFLYYSGRYTVRYDQLDVNHFRLLREYAGARHWYAVLPSWEREEIRRLGANWIPIGTVRRITIYQLAE